MVFELSSERTYAFVRGTLSTASGKALCLLPSDEVVCSFLGIGRSGVDKCAAIRFCYKKKLEMDFGYSSGFYYFIYLFYFICIQGSDLM